MWSEAVALHDAHGQPRGFLGTVVDVTERHVADRRVHEARAQLERHAAELERSNADLEQFAYVASHDLSEPLHVIRGFLELLAKHEGATIDEAGHHYIASALGGVHRMQSLIDDLLAFSRVGRAELVRIDVESSAIVADVIELLEPSISRARVELEVGELPVVRAEPRMLAQAFQNLISNAIKFGGAEKTIRIGGEPELDGWRFWVADEGPGIDAGQAERVFEMFQRLHGREVPGTGIGLAICKRVVERHEGRIWHEPRPEGGTVFMFTIRDPR